MWLRLVPRIVSHLVATRMIPDLLTLMRLLRGLLFWTFWICHVHAIPLLHVDHPGPVMATVGSDVKLSCWASQWTDGYTITWSKNSSGEVLSKNLYIVADPSRYSVTTVTNSDLDSTTWTLSIKEASQADSGDYTCSLKTEPPQFVSVNVIIQIPLTSDLPPEVVRWDVSECCHSRSVPGQCMPLCNTMSSGFDVMDAMRTSDRCRQHHDPWFRCLANDRNHTPCCKRRHVPEKCLDLCLGNFSTVFREGNLDCLHFVAVIFKCFHDGRESIPSSPRSVRVALVGGDSLRVSWSPPIKHGKEVNYTVIYKAIGNTDPGLRRAGGLTKAMSTAALGLILSNLVHGENYKIHVVALNAAGSSLPSETISVDIPQPVTVPAKETGQNLEGQTLQYNTTMDSTATLPVDSPRETSLKPAEMAQMQTVTHPADDFVVFDKCYGLPEFRSSCSEVLMTGAGRTGKNVTVVKCRDSLPRFLGCAANDGDHRKCCSRNAVPPHCAEMCAGRPSGMFDKCHSYLQRVLMCFREASMFLSSEPLGVAAELRESQIVIQWQPPATNAEMVENYVVVVEDGKSRDRSFEVTVPRDVLFLNVDPLNANISLPVDHEYVIYVQAENFHGLSRRSEEIPVNVGELNSIQQPSAITSSAGPGVAIGVSTAGVAVVILVVLGAYCLRRRRGSCGNPVSVASGALQNQIGDDKSHKPLNAFYIPGYFGKRGISRTQKTISNSSASYATSFSLRPRSSNSSEPVYSDVSGAYLWMFGNDKKAPAPHSHPHQSCSRKSSSEHNIYDNNIPGR